jgi:hypothetical protein
VRRVFAFRLSADLTVIVDQLNLYLENYHAALDERRRCGVRGGEMIAEL